ncbi:MAG: DNA adenine methylase [Candidatus Campbellbacteria bacterium]|nr:DNA adenine methylase [Candidatus Campbellbacteria bacterium]
MGRLNRHIFEEKRKRLLQCLESKKTKYKRLSLSPIRYAGGKSLAVGHIIEAMPPVKRIISPFFGGGSIEIALAQKLDIEIIACDINKPLVNYWQYQINQPKRLYAELKKLKPTKLEYEKIKKILKEWKNGEIKLTKLEQATYFFFNHNLSYGPSFIGWASSVYLNETKYNKMIEKVRDFKANIKITCEPFENLFFKYKKDFFYCDPPYFLKTDDETSKMFNGIYPERNNPIHHKSFNHELLRDLLNNHKGGFILSYNNCSKSREYYKRYKLKYPSWQYTMGQGETRISKVLKNRDIKNKNSHIKMSHEILVISN